MGGMGRHRGCVVVLLERAMVALDLPERRRGAVMRPVAGGHHLDDMIIINHCGESETAHGEGDVSVAARYGGKPGKDGRTSVGGRRSKRVLGTSTRAWLGRSTHNNKQRVSWEYRGWFRSGRRRGKTRQWTRMVEAAGRGRASNLNRLQAGVWSRSPSCRMQPGCSRGQSVSPLLPARPSSPACGVGVPLEVDFG